MTRVRCICLTFCVLVSFSCSFVQAQTSGQETEVGRLQGNWRIVEMVENGHTVMEHEMRRTLPGGGLVEIIDNTLLFKSPVDGSKSTKSFRLDSASYPKKIAIVERDTVTGAGIYEFDQGKFVMCVASPGTELPTELSAPQGSNRVLMVLQSYDPGKSDLQMDISPRPRVNMVPVSHSAAKRESKILSLPQPPAEKAVPQTIIVQEKIVPPTVIVQQTPAPQIVVQQVPAGRILSDKEVREMLVGKWQFTDGEGLIEVSLYPNATFQTHRRSSAVSTFHSTFVATPVSAGNWEVVGNGQLNMKVTSSWRPDKVNFTTSMAVKTISSNDAVLVDRLGRVARAVKID